MKTAISNVAPGQVVKFHGEPCIVLEHRTAGTLLVTAAQIKSSFGSTNNFAVSSFREHLNGAFADAMTEGHADELITRVVDLTALNGSKEYGSCECKVAPLTFDEIRRFHGLLPKPESWEWSALVARIVLQHCRFFICGAGGISLFRPLTVNKIRHH